ncbi:hypothetical protein NP061_007385 [Weissella confusa]|uniref:Uncharacterized protein n=1 Tax=Limosilactobacillus reuteri TaxID=1598 RepID=A0A2T5Q2G7_LIMRT|nr:hypothetical protein [Limosilactobacillus reuteri]MCW3764190.1 hypothetical protein [Weissella confusa]PTV03436.1 hypothetical protein DB325_07435 [Limosilactobacillus reuteri]
MLDILKKSINAQLEKMKTLGWWFLVLIFNFVPQVHNLMEKALDSLVGKTTISGIVYADFVFVTAIVIYYLVILFRTIFLKNSWSENVTESMCKSLTKIVFNTPIIWLQLLVLINISSNFLSELSKNRIFVFEFCIVFFIQVIVALYHLIANTCMEDKIWKA